MMAWSSKPTFSADRKLQRGFRQTCDSRWLQRDRPGIAKRPAASAQKKQLPAPLGKR
jgi:hypothetical protein